MSFAPDNIINVRKLIQKYTQLSNVELGIVGSDSHANSGTSYHLGKDAVKPSAYSVVESKRDSRGLTDAASALDIGWFSIATPKGKKNLRDLSKWLVAQCKAGAGDADDIREIIYSADGVNVLRWDKLKKRTTGDNSHLTHTHVSWFRDSQSADRAALFRRWFIEIGLREDPNVLNAEDKAWIASEISRAVAAANAVPGKVWETPLVRPADKKPIKAGDFLRYNDDVNVGTANRAADRVIARIDQLPGK